MEERKELLRTAALIMAVFLVAFAVFGLLSVTVKENMGTMKVSEKGCRYCLADHGIKVSPDEILSPHQIEMCRNCEPAPWDDLAP